MGGISLPLPANTTWGRLVFCREDQAATTVFGRIGKSENTFVIIPNVYALEKGAGVTSIYTDACLCWPAFGQSLSGIPTVRDPFPDASTTRSASRVLRLPAGVS